MITRVRLLFALFITQGYYHNTMCFSVLSIYLLKFSIMIEQLQCLRLQGKRWFMFMANAHSDLHSLCQLYRDHNYLHSRGSWNFFPLWSEDQLEKYQCKSRSQKEDRKVRKIILLLFRVWMHHVRSCITGPGLPTCLFSLSHFLLPSPTLPWYWIAQFPLHQFHLLQCQEILPGEARREEGDLTMFVAFVYD